MMDLFTLIPGRARNDKKGSVGGEAPRGSGLVREKLGTLSKHKGDGDQSHWNKKENDPQGRDFCFLVILTLKHVGNDKSL